MNAITKQELEKAGADLTGVAKIPTAQQEAEGDLNEPVLDNQNIDMRTEESELAPLFLPDVAKEFRSRWDTVQRGFVDDPRQAVRQADELVVQVMKSLAETFSHERGMLEGQVNQTGKASTETLRIALRRYRSFFERLLSLENSSVPAQLKLSHRVPHDG
jgi:hypothetical protein